MATQKVIFYTDATHTQSYRLPYLGDITRYPEGNPAIAGVSGGFQNLRGIEFAQTFSNGRGGCDLKLLQGSFSLYSTPSLQYGINSTYMTADQQVRVQSANQGGSYNIWSDRNNTVGMGLAVAKVNGTTRLGIVIWGHDWGGVNHAYFMYSYDDGNALNMMFNTADRPGDPFNPYSEGGYSEPGGGENTNYDDASDGVEADALPTISAVGCGLISIFSPTEQQLSHLADVLCGGDFFDFLQNTVENLSELFISFGIVPFVVPTSGTVNITFFDWLVTLKQQSTNIPVRLVADQFIDFDMGTINLADDPRIHKTDSVFDYSPFSKLGIYLPFIGFEELDIDEVRTSIIHLEYRVDVLSGSCVALVSTIVDNVKRTLYQFTGNCLTQLPLSSADCQTMITNAVNLGISVATAGTTGAVASAGAESVEAALGAEKINRQTADFRNAQFDAQVSNAKGNLVSATANTIMGMKPNYKHSGAIGASASLLAVKQPYLFLLTPNEAVPEGYERYCGFPSNITSRLGDLSGYTVVEDIRLNGLVATSNEVAEIYSLLKKGVII